MTRTRARHLGGSPVRSGQRAPRSSSSDHSVAPAAPHACCGSTGRASVHRVLGRAHSLSQRGRWLIRASGQHDAAVWLRGAGATRAGGGGVRSARADRVGLVTLAGVRGTNTRFRGGHLHRRADPGGPPPSRRSNRSPQPDSCEQTSNTGCTRRRAAGLC